jgi:hypothetical protein
LNPDIDAITVAAASSRFGVDRRTIQAWVLQGKVDRIFTGEKTGPHRRYLVTVDSLKRYQRDKLGGLK